MYVGDREGGRETGNEKCRRPEKKIEHLVKVGRDTGSAIDRGG